MLVEPDNGLAEGLLLGELLLRVAQVTAHGKAVANATEQVDLPGLSGLDESLLGFVTKLGGEDLIDLCWKLAVQLAFRKSGSVNIPEAAIEKGPWMAPSSSWVTKEG